LLDNSDSHLLFTVVLRRGGHEHASKTLNNGALSLLESALLVATGGVGHEDLLTNGFALEVVGKGVVWALHAFVRPLAEKFRLHSEYGLVVVLHNDGVVML